MTDPLIEQHLLEFPGGYTRSVGPVVGRFLTAVRDDAQLLGVRLADGRVLCPPVEYDPETSETVPTRDGVAEYVPVGPGGEVVSWTWVAEPRSEHPLDRPFAFALVRPDGADTSILQVVDVGDASAMATGLRVTASFSDERIGHVSDFVFVPESEA